MTRIPKSAMPVVEILRRDVKRPSDFALVHNNNYRVRIRVKCSTRCPMGMHPKSEHGEPSIGELFAGGVLPDRHVLAFATWWDGLTIAEASQAIDLIWPKGGGK